MLTEAQARANKKYNAKSYDLLSLRVPKGERELIRNFADTAGLSLPQYIRMACYEKAGRACPPMKGRK